MSKSSHLKTVEQMVAKARERIRSLSLEEVVTQIDRGDALLVDLREDDERFLEGTIPNSMHVPRRTWKRDKRPVEEVSFGSTLGFSELSPAS